MILLVSGCSGASAPAKPTVEQARSAFRECVSGDRTVSIREIGDVRETGSEGTYKVRVKFADPLTFRGANGKMSSSYRSAVLYHTADKSWYALCGFLSAPT